MRFDKIGGAVDPAAVEGPMRRVVRLTLVAAAGSVLLFCCVFGGKETLSNWLGLRGVTGEGIEWITGPPTDPLDMGGVWAPIEANRILPITNEKLSVALDRLAHKEIVHLTKDECEAMSASAIRTNDYKSIMLVRCVKYTGRDFEYISMRCNDKYIEIECLEIPGETLDKYPVIILIPTTPTKLTSYFTAPIPTIPIRRRWSF